MRVTEKTVAKAVLLRMVLVLVILLGAVWVRAAHARKSGSIQEIFSAAGARARMDATSFQGAEVKRSGEGVIQSIEWKGPSPRDQEMTTLKQKVQQLEARNGEISSALGGALQSAQNDNKKLRTDLTSMGKSIDRQNELVKTLAGQASKADTLETKLATFQEQMNQWMTQVQQMMQTNPYGASAAYADPYSTDPYSRGRMSRYGRSGDPYGQMAYGNGAGPYDRTSEQMGVDPTTGRAVDSLRGEIRDIKDSLLDLVPKLSRGRAIPATVADRRSRRNDVELDEALEEIRSH